MKRLLLLLALAPACGDKDSPSESGDTATYTELREIDLGTYHLMWAPDPDPIPFNDYFDVTVTVTEGGNPVSDATVNIAGQMPVHGHGMNVDPQVTNNGDGTYTASGLLFHMEGHWQLLVDVGEQQAVFDITCCS